MEQTSQTSAASEEAIRKFYDRYVRDHGSTIGWSSMESAYSAYGGASGCDLQKWPEFRSILDIGCGEGHLLPYVRERCGFNGHYTGIEILSSFYDRAVELYGGENNARFIKADFLSWDFEGERFDWVISLGANSVKHDDQEAYDRQLCARMVALTDGGLSIYVNDIEFFPPERFKDAPGLAAHDVNEIAEILRELQMTNIRIEHFSERVPHQTIIHAAKSDAAGPS